MRDGVREINLALPNVDTWGQTLSASLGPGLGENMLWQPSAGAAFVLHSLYMSIAAPVGALSGDHGLIFRMRRVADGLDYTFAELTVPHNQPFTLAGLYAHAPVPLTVERPLGHNAQVSVFKGLLIDRSQFLVTRYVNRTDAAQTAARFIVLFFERRTINN